LHWADQSTLDLIAFLARSLREARVLLVATYRSDELHRRHPLRPLLTRWERIRSIGRIELRRFERDEVSAQLAAILGAAPAGYVVDVIFDRSGGNAYLVEELAGAVRSDGDLADLPPSLKGGFAQPGCAAAAQGRFGGGAGCSRPPAGRGGRDRRG
jgi:predicted ATPase